MNTINSLANRLLAWVLCFAMLLSMVPALNVEAEEQVSYGIVSELTPGSTVEDQDTDTGRTTVISYSGLELKFFDKDPTIGRNQDGWWVGIKIAAPENMTKEEQFVSGENAVTYQRKNGDGWKDAVSFWDAQESDKEAPEAERYKTFWCLISESSLRKSNIKGKNLTYTWRFDWNMDGVYEHTVQLSVDPANTTLMKGDEQIYPAASVGNGKVEALLDGGAVDVHTEDGVEYVTATFSGMELQFFEADETIGRPQDGWWVGIKVSAPETMTTLEDFENANGSVTYQRKQGDGWGAAKVFWDAQYSDKNAVDTARYVTLWGLITPEYLKNALNKGKNVNYTWRFDWNNDGLYEQVVCMSTNPADMLLVKKGVQMYPFLGEVTPLSGGSVAGSGTGKTTVTIDNASLTWAPVDTSIGRNQAGWWVGIQVNAPEGMTDEELMNSKYKTFKTSWSEERIFWEHKNSADDAERHFVQLWMLLTPQMLSESETVSRMYYFDWDGNGNAEQEIVLTAVSEGIVLNGVQQPEAAFQYPMPENQPADKTFTNPVINIKGNCEVTYSIVSGEDAAEVNEQTGEVTFLKADVPVTVKATVSADKDGFYNAAELTYTVTAYSIDRDGFRFETQNPGHVIYAPHKSFENTIVQEHKKGVVYSIESMTVEGMAEINSQTGVLTIKKAGTVTVKATKKAMGIHKYSEATYTLTIGKAPQEQIMLSDYVLNLVWNEQLVTLPSVSGGTGTGEIEMKIIKGDDVVALDQSTSATMLKLLKAGDAFIEIRKKGDDCYEPSNIATLQIHIEKASQTGFGFVLEGEKSVTVTYNENGNEFVLPAQGSLSSARVQYSVVYEGEKAPVAVDENGVVKVLCAGTAVIKAVSPSDDHYRSAEDSYTITVLHADQEFTLGQGDSCSIEYGISEFRNEVILPENNSGNALEYEIVGENEIGAEISGNGTVTFVDSEQKVGKITVRVKLEGDDCYHPCEKEYTLDVKYMDVSQLSCDVTGNVAEGNTTGWFIGDVAINAPEGYVISYANERSTDDWAASVPHDTEGVADAKVYLRDPNTGAMSDEIIIKDIKLDTNAPVLTENDITYNITLWDTIAESVFGFSFDAVRVTVAVKDVNGDVANASSGIALMEYSIDGENFSVAAENQIVGSTFFFDIPAQYRNMVSIRLTDVAGNRSDVFKDGKTLVVDQDKPIITWTPSGAYITEGETLLTSDENFEITIQVTDSNYDLRAQDPKVEINGQTVDVEWNHQATCATAVLTFPEDGDYHIAVSFDDRINEADQVEMDVNVDRTAPVIGVCYENKNVTGTNDHRKYYDAAQSATITIADANLIPEDITVTILPESYKPLIEWKLVNVDGFVETWEAVIPFGDDYNYTLAVSCEDKLDQTSTYGADEFTVDTKDPAVPVISYDKTVLNQVMEVVTFGFFQSPVKVTITSGDDTAGVQYIEYSYVGKSGKYTTKTVDVNGSQNGDSISFVVDASFRGIVSAKAYDYAGRCSESRNVGTDAAGTELGGIVVDSVDPIRIIAPQTQPNRIVGGGMKDVQSFAEGDGTVLYYNQDVVIGFRVEEENFYPADMVITVNDTPVALSDWNNTAENVWVGTLTLKDQGDYVIRASYADKSTNKMADYESQRIVIDKTAPLIEVAYGNQDVKNTIDGRDYFDKKQTATITITEHNFRADEVRILVSAKNVEGKDLLKLNDNGTVEVYAAQGADRGNWTPYTAGTWRNEKDTYVLELVYDASANYTFDVEYEDLAKNPAADYAQDLFTVDDTAPQVSIAYSAHVFQEILNTITFGYYNSNVTVTMTAVDDITPIHRFVYSYLKAAGTSSVNTQLLEQAIEEGSFTQKGSKAVATITVPRQVLNGRNQFNGTIAFTAYNRSELNTRLEDNKRLVVDNIAPNATVSYNAPVQERNGVAYYNGNINAAITINEANFFARDVVVTVTKDRQSYPVNVTWVNNSYDVHTGSFTLTEDGNYTVSVQYQDKSGNQMKTYTSGILTLDTQAPVIRLSGVGMNTANKDETCGFTITVTDTNLNIQTLDTIFSYVSKGDNGLYTTSTMDLGEAMEVDAGKQYTHTILNLDMDAIYSLSCVVRDLSGNTMSGIVLDDGAVYETVRFSVNREGSTFAFGDSYTEDLVNKYYVYSVEGDVVIQEVNVDPIENYVVLLNGASLTEGQDYTTVQTSKEGEWSIRTYTVNKALFEAEGEYSIVISSTDKTETTAYSDVKNLTVAFVVDQTKPVLNISGLEEGGRYQTDSQKVTLIPSDEGGLLNGLTVTLLDRDGQALGTLFDMKGEEFRTYLEENDGVVSFQIPEGFENQVRIICTDCAVHSDGTTNTYDETFARITVSANQFVIFFANRTAFGLTAAAAVAAIGTTAALILRKKSRKKENSKV